MKRIDQTYFFNRRVHCISIERVEGRGREGAEGWGRGTESEGRVRGRGGRGRDEGNPPGGRFSQGRAVVEGGAAICSSLGGSSAACVLFIECVVVVIFFPRKCQECGFVFECLWVSWADFH